MKLAGKPSVIRNSIYRVKRSYWKHVEEKKFCRRLIEIEGTLYCHNIVIIIIFI